MTAETLREAARVLRERAEAATPGPWSAADEHGLMPEAWPAWCVSQMRPGYESMSPEGGYVKDVADVHGDDKAACPDADYIAAVHPGVGLALADWLEDEIHRARYREDQQRIANATRLRAEPFRCYYDKSTEHALTVARAILGESA